MTTTHGRGRRAASACRASWKPTSPCWRARRMPPPTSVGNLQPCRRHSRPFGAAGAGGVECRAAAKDPALAELVRKEQDLGKQVNAQLGTLNNVLSLPSGERDDQGRPGDQRLINALRAARLKARQEIGQRFPRYADLVAPKPPSVEQIKATLTDGEAMLSFYFGQTSSFVWAVPKKGRSRSPRSRPRSGDIESKVRKLREALEPQAAMISDIPPFDLKLAHELSLAAAAAGRERMEAGQEPGPGDQRRARTAAIVAVADGARRDRQRRRSAVCRLQEGAVAGADACGHDRACRRRRCAPCANCRPASPTAAN